MSDYPDPDEEYELMYAEEYELMREQENPTESNVKKNLGQAKRSLDFTSPASSQVVPVHVDSNVSEINQDEVLPNSLLPMVDLTSVNEDSGAKKRTVEEIFGDIGDLDFNENLPSKKQKTEEEVDMEMIERILQERRIRQLLSKPTSRVQAEGHTNYDIKENMSIDIPRWPFIPVTNCYGDRVYVKLQSEDIWNQSLDDTKFSATLFNSYEKVWEEARKILEKKLDNQLKTQETSDVEFLPDIEADVQNNNVSLWVEKYKPQSYLDLLTEEPINRTVLHWLHLWDKIVFNKEVKTTDPQQRTSFSKRTGQFQLTNKWKGKRFTPECEMDEDGRPHHKVVLLCGPPGVGKTTLAHLLAKLAGYRPVELNASDERSVEAFSNAIKSATLMRSVLDVERRPNCLILDEIDGAPLPTVELLVKWCTATKTEGKKKGKIQPLKRPIIAICNELYTPALRPLRAISLIVHVNGVSESRLRSRLGSVCAKEGVTAAPHVLAALSARVHGDIRAATTTLQFLKNKHVVTLDDVTNISVGEKDSNKNVVQALQSIFTTNDDIDPLNTVLRTVMAAGEYDRIIEGIFENYLTARVDSRLNIACVTMGWLMFYDYINTWTLKRQNYSLYSLLPLCAARCYSVLSSRHASRVKFPLVAQEINRKIADHRGIAESLYRGVTPAVLTMRKALLLDVVALLPYLLAPNLRSANIQLCSENEKKSLLSAASAMCDYGLQYTQQRLPDGTYATVMEPEINKLAFFGSEDRVRLAPAIKQTISREQQLEQIRRIEGHTSKPATGTPSKPQKTLKPAEKSNPEDKALPNHLQRLQPKAIEKSTPQVHRDFFGRVVPISEAVHRSDAARDLISSSKVFYHYQEGFNNAVRRSVRIRDLL